MRVIVLGAGVIGVTSAWFLAKIGHEVIVVDRQPDVGLETSFANGGQISASHAQPWANFHMLLKVFKWILRKDAPLLFRMRTDFSQWCWGMRFLFECLPWRNINNTQQIITLALHSRTVLNQLLQEVEIDYDSLKRGILHVFTNPDDFRFASARVDLLRQHGCDLEVLTPSQCLTIEPALIHSKLMLVGGIYSALDSSGNAHKFTQNLAALCQRRGVTFFFNTKITALQARSNCINGVEVMLAEGKQKLLQADAYLVCLGSYSSLLLKPIGIKLTIYPAKGYSVTIPISSRDIAPSVSLTDEQHKLVFSRLGDYLRIAGTAELNGYNTDINTERCMAILHRALDWFPNIANSERAQFWTGLRPATPSNVPIIGRTRYDNLFLNTGHGTLGWTMACGSGQAVANIVSGNQPKLNFNFLR